MRGGQHLAFGVAACAGGGVRRGRPDLYGGGGPHPQAPGRTRPGDRGRPGAERGVPVLPAGAGLDVEPACQRAGRLRLLPAARHAADQRDTDGAVGAWHRRGLVRVLPVHGAGGRRGPGGRGGRRDRRGRAVRRICRAAAATGRG
ncbi:hypothetical protein G6F62_014939 [Rhizopus arrhizus]|nr:hypothetical protein G6F62_014939 [Rhizopus arrhizus]